ncbi:glycerophosphoryl diester phosphodiesterase [Hymenobacter gelipurpurascens]|uniref:Glycerophosphoryl diester phosphodiesterase n=1 Tax=Hymenobacter gelipurpurascens TaxID=89968 RepID=A0A212TB41_9BACT|nr:glycerophosphodiester phosphodiesterase family protein [Hymenobacter gelipurpurascens]SNC63070.1 glycerophosphoryl diester phosphodiesterase [Hymenobacter gelipurpurascens]
MSTVLGASLRWAVLSLAVSSAPLAAGLAAPAPPPLMPASALVPGPPLVIGHAGSGFFTPFLPFNPLPPSSLRSIEKALRRNADGVEVDIRLSQDSIPVLYHDHTLNSMSDGQGCVSQTTAAALQLLHYRGGWPYDWFQQEKISTFETLLSLLAQRPTFPYLHLDLHEDDACSNADVVRSQALARRLVRLLTHYHVPPEKVLILTNRPSTLAYLHHLLPAMPLGLEITDEFDEGMLALSSLDVQAVVLPKNAVTAARVTQIHALGRQVVVFGGRSTKALRRVVSCQPDAYEVDNVRRLQAVLRRVQTNHQETLSSVHATSP